VPSLTKHRQARNDEISCLAVKCVGNRCGKNYLAHKQGSVSFLVSGFVVDVRPDPAHSA